MFIKKTNLIILSPVHFYDTWLIKMRSDTFLSSVQSTDSMMLPGPRCAFSYHLLHERERFCRLVFNLPLDAET